MPNNLLRYAALLAIYRAELLHFYFSIDSVLFASKE